MFALASEVPSRNRTRRVKNKLNTSLANRPKIKMTSRTVQDITTELDAARKRVQLLEKELEVAALRQSPTTTVSFYVDGSCLDGNTAKHNPRAGWGFVGVEVKKTVDDDGKVVSKTDEFHKVKGTVVVDRDNEWYIGADKFSNNTAELSAIYHVLDYIANNVFDPNQTVTIYYDSVYAAKSVMGIFNGPKNKDLITACREKLRACKGKAKVVFKHVKAHSGHKYNDMVDGLAKEGAKLCTHKKRKIDNNE